MSMQSMSLPLEAGRHTAQNESKIAEEGMSTVYHWQ